MFVGFWTSQNDVGIVKFVCWLKIETCLAGGLGQGFDAAVKFVGSAVEFYFFYVDF